MRTAEDSLELQNAEIVRPWHALYTRYQHEKRVAQSLAIKNHDVFLPIYGVVHRWQDRSKQLWLPLFPCYIFIRGGMDRQVQLLTTPGMVGILQSSGRPAIIPPEQIDAICRIVESSLRIQPHPFLGCGARVRVKSGPMAGIEGILVRKKGMCRLVISMEMLGRSAAVEIDISCVEPIGPLPAAMQLFPRSIAS